MCTGLLGQSQTWGGLRKKTVEAQQNEENDLSVQKRLRLLHMCIKYLDNIECNFPPPVTDTADE